MDGISQAIGFLQQSIKSWVPANMFIVIDMHLEVRGRRLQWGRERLDLVSAVVGRFVKAKLLAEMKGTAEHACQSSRKPRKRGK